MNKQARVVSALSIIDDTLLLTASTLAIILEDGSAPYSFISVRGEAVDLACDCGHSRNAGYRERPPARHQTPPTCPPAETGAAAQLVQRLNDGLAAGRQITLLSAPAGFGKTVCAADWVRTLEWPVAWLTLDSADDEPQRFFTYFFAALQQAAPGIGEEIAALLASFHLAISSAQR